MQAVVLATNMVTMSSLDMVDFINANRKPGEAVLRHDHFMAKVPKVLGEAAPNFLGTALYINGTGAKVARETYNFPKREACLMAMSYSYELQAKVFDRMTALENKAPALDLNDPTMLRPLLLSYAEQLIEAKTTIAEQAPKVAALEDMEISEGSFTPRVAGPMMGMTQTQTYEWLIQRKWCYREAQTDDRPGRLRAYSDRVKSGHLQERMVKAGFTRDGVEQMKAQVYLTPKGMVLVRKLRAGAVESYPPMAGDLDAQLNELNRVAAKACNVVGLAEVKKTIASFGAPRLDENCPSQYPHLLAALNKLINEPF